MEYKWISQDKNGEIVKYYDTEPTIGERDVGFINGYKWSLFKEGKQNPNWRESLINLKTHDYKIEDGILMKVEKGLKIQYKHKDLKEWKDLVMPQCVFRIKPKTKTVRFRNFLHIDEYVETCISEDENVENKDYFVKWIGDWQEVEIEQ